MSNREDQLIKKTFRTCLKFENVYRKYSNKNNDDLSLISNFTEYGAQSMVARCRDINN